MISPTELQNLKDHLNKLVVKDVKQTLRTFKEALPKNSPRYNDLLNLEGQFNDHSRNKINNVITTENEQIVSNQIREKLISLIYSLELKDFENSTPILLSKTNKRTLLLFAYLLLGIGLITVLSFFYINRNNTESWFTLPNNKTGHLLYKIPEKMQVNKEYECIVRIAFDSVSITRDLIRGEVTIKPIDISEKMKVGLDDDSPDMDVFKIRNKLDGNEQFISKSNYTEWKFGVTPLKEGIHNLLIKVTVLKKINGEYVSNYPSFNNKIEITTHKVTQTDSGFIPTGQIVSVKSKAFINSQIQTEEDYLKEESRRIAEERDKNDERPREFKQDVVIYFKFNSTKYYESNEINNYLESIIEKLNQANEQIFLFGHTDNVGSENYNLELGKRRAEKIANFLISKGLKRNLIKVISKGEKHPTDTNETENGRQGNRRVEIRPYNPYG